MGDSLVTPQVSNTVHAKLIKPPEFVDLVGTATDTTGSNIDVTITIPRVIPVGRTIVMYIDSDNSNIDNYRGVTDSRSNFYERITTFNNTSPTALIIARVRTQLEIGDVITIRWQSAGGAARRLAIAEELKHVGHVETRLLGFTSSPGIIVGSQKGLRFTPVQTNHLFWAVYNPQSNSGGTTWQAAASPFISDSSRYVSVSGGGFGFVNSIIVAHYSTTARTGNFDALWTPGSASFWVAGLELTGQMDEI